MIQVRSTFSAVALQILQDISTPIRLVSSSISQHTLHHTYLWLTLSLISWIHLHTPSSILAIPPLTKLRSFEVIWCIHINTLFSRLNRLKSSQIFKRKISRWIHQTTPSLDKTVVYLDHYFYKIFYHFLDNNLDTGCMSIMTPLTMYGVKEFSFLKLFSLCPNKFISTVTILMCVWNAGTY